MASIKSQDNSMYLGSSFDMLCTLREAEQNDLCRYFQLSSYKMNCSFLQGLFALVNRLVVQLGLNLINSLTALYSSQNTWFHVETTQGVISILHLPWSSSVTSSLWETHLPFTLPCSSPTSLKSPRKCSSHFRTPIYSHPTSSPMLEASVRKVVGAGYF